MKILLRVLISTVLLLPIASLVLTEHHHTEAAGNTFMDMIKIDRSQNVSALHVFEEQIITTYRESATRPALISSYSKTGTLNWEISEYGPHAISEYKFARVRSGVLYIYSTATGKVLTSTAIPFGASKMYMTDAHIVLVTSSSFSVYDTSGKYIMKDNADGIKGASLSRNTLVLQDSKGVHSFDFAARKKMWSVPLEPFIVNERMLKPTDNVVYALGVEKRYPEHLIAPKDILIGINATTGAVLYKKDFGEYEETYARIKEFGLMINHPFEDIHHIYNPDGSVKMELNMESAAIKQLKEKYFVYGTYYNGAEDFIAAREGLYYFKTYDAVHKEFLFSSLKSLDQTGAVSFEKVFENEYIFGIATSDSNKLFVATGNRLVNSSELNKLSVYDSKGALLDTIQTGYIERLQSDGSSLYGYGNRTLYIFKESEPKNVPRISGFSRYDTAVAISQKGWESAGTVVVATGTDFPDALAGGPLAYQEDAPILLTRPASLSSATEKEIIRLKAEKAIILGSEGAVSQAVEDKLTSLGLSVERIGGKSRYDTARLIADKISSDKAIVAYGFNFPDVLAISPYAAKNGIPILLTRTDRLPDETKAAIKGKTSTIVVGSTGAVSAEVFSQLPQPVRYGGKNRFDTAKEISLKLPLGVDQAYVATGQNFPDALAGSVLAAKNDASILLVNEASIPAATNDILSRYRNFSIFGSAGAVGDEVRLLLKEEMVEQRATE